MTLAVIAWIGAFIALGGLAMQLANLSEFPQLLPHTLDTGALDVYVAVRDEEQNVVACLESILAQSEVARAIVADDGSRDSTPQLVLGVAASEPRVVYVRVADGEGKGHALGEVTRTHPPVAPYVLFVDGDVRLGTGAAGALLREMQARSVPAVSAWPRVAAGSFWSALAAPAVTLFLLQALPMRLARGSDPRFSAGNGQLFAVESRLYVLSGGHAASQAIVEDIALARTLKRADGRVALASAARIATAGGYATLGATVRGHARSLYFGSGVAGCITVALWQLFAYVLPCALVTYEAIPCLIAILCAAISRALAAVRMREPAWTAILFPLGAAFVVLIATYAAIAGSLGALTWRQRRLEKQSST